VGEVESGWKKEVSLSGDEESVLEIMIKNAYRGGYVRRNRLNGEIRGERER
jgi:hypothetical protein